MVATGLLSCLMKSMKWENILQGTVLNILSKTWRHGHQ